VPEEEGARAAALGHGRPSTEEARPQRRGQAESRRPKRHANIGGGGDTRRISESGTGASGPSSTARRHPTVPAPEVVTEVGGEMKEGSRGRDGSTSLKSRVWPQPWPRARAAKRRRGAPGRTRSKGRPGRPGHRVTPQVFGRVNYPNNPVNSVDFGQTTVNLGRHLENFTNDPK
jgi:hypothetical protein